VAWSYSFKQQFANDSSLTSRDSDWFNKCASSRSHGNTSAVFVAALIELQSSLLISLYFTFFLSGGGSLTLSKFSELTDEAFLLATGVVEDKPMIFDVLLGVVHW
jgi:hypothetical protein